MSHDANLRYVIFTYSKKIKHLLLKDKLDPEAILHIFVNLLASYFEALDFSEKEIKEVFKEMIKNIKEAKSTQESQNPD